MSKKDARMMVSEDSNNLLQTIPSDSSHQMIGRVVQSDDVISKGFEQIENASIHNSYWVAEGLRSFLFLGVLPLIWRLGTTFLASVISLLTILNAAYDNWSFSSLPEVINLSFRFFSSLVMLVSSLPAINFSWTRFLNMRQKMSLETNVFINVKIDYRPKPYLSMTVLQGIVVLMCIMSFYAYTIQQYSALTATLYSLFDLPLILLTSCALCMICDLMSSHPALLSEETSGFFHYIASLLWALHYELDIFWTLTIIHLIFFIVDSRLSKRRKILCRFGSITIIPTIVHLYHDSISSAELRTLPSFGYATHFSHVVNIAVSYAIEVVILKFFRINAREIEKIWFWASRHYIETLYYWIFYPVLFYRKFIRPTLKRTLTLNRLTVFIVGCTSLIWILPASPPISELISQVKGLNSPEDFFTNLKFSKRNETPTSYLSCDFSRPDIGIITHFPMYKLAAVSDIVYGSLGNLEERKMVEKLLNMKYIHHDDVISNSSTNLNTARFDLWEDEHAVVFALRGTWDYSIFVGTIGAHTFIQSLPFPLPYYLFIQDNTVSHLEQSLHGSFVHPTDLYFQESKPGDVKHQAYKHVIKSLVKWASDKGKPLILTGHSLGGVIAQVMAAQIALNHYFNVTAVAFNSPGIRWTQQFLHADHSILMEHSINVNSKFDPVSLVDEPRGSVFTLKCPSGFTGCHSMTYMLCELWYSCEEKFPKFCEPWLPLKQVERNPESREFLYKLSLLIKYLSIVLGRFLVFGHIYWAIGHQQDLIKKQQKSDDEMFSQVGPEAVVDDKAKKWDNESKSSNGGKKRRTPKPLTEERESK